MYQEISPGEVASEFYTKIDSDHVRCDLCPRYCVLKEGQRGFCFVRMAQNGQIVMTSYGRSSGFCIDPIEKKPLNHFYPGTPVLSFGTAGCNLGCNFCQNWDLSKAKEHSRLLQQAYPKAIAQAAVAAQCKSVAFTYNDPVVFFEYAIDTAIACREQKIEPVVVSAGYINDKPREQFFAPMSAANIDLKAFDANFYRKYCLAELEPVKETLIYIKQKTNVWLEITTLLIPEANDSELEIGKMCEWILEALGPTVPVHFTSFHPDYKLTDRRATSAATLKRARQQALNLGLHYVYTGNVYDPDGQSTLCPNCQQVVIGRNGYDISTWAIDDNGGCLNCHTTISGHFEKTPGSWGAKRQSIVIK
ncbi:MAG: AmmeMemoRadiSam system radical SAM enzyme [Deltaproteobacteria bacterium]|nr:AmmeMemoRadiSam system radical SAM enzyme [Deltaproteobacteria bacterium]